MMNKPLLRNLILIFAILFGLSITVLSVLPINRMALGTRPRFAATPAAIQRAADFHIVVHVVIFGVLAGAAWFAADLTSDPQAKKNPSGKILALVLVLLLGCGTEYLQHEVYGQILELNDVCTNLIASVSVFGILTLINHYRKRRPEAQPGADDVVYVLRDLD